MSSAPSVPALDQGTVRAVLAARAGERLALSVIAGDSAYAAPFGLPEQLEEAVEWVRQRATTDRTVSVGVASLSSEGAARLVDCRRRGVRARPRHGEHTGYAWVVADLDPHDGEQLAGLHARLGRYPHPPTLLASSGRGLHAWWHLAEPVDVATGRQLCEDLARALEGDPGAADEGRALRLPGTYNGKPGVERLAAVLEHEPTRRYPAEQLTAAALTLSPRPAPPAPRPRRLLELREGLDVAEQLRAGHDLAEELDRVAGPRSRQHKWRCPTGHDGTASLGLHRDDPQRWVCFGGGHEAGFGRPTKGGQHSGDVVDLLALESGQSVERFLSAERARLAPVHLTPPDAVTGDADTRPSSVMSVSTAQDDVPLPPEPPAEAAPSPAPSRGAGKGGGGKKADQPSQADLLVQQALRTYTLGRSKTEPYAVPHTGPRVALALRGGGNSLRQHLAAAFAREHGKTATTGALADALNTLEGYALETDPTDVDLRLARQEHPDGRSRIVLDLGDAAGRAVVAGPDGWQVLDRSPVVFRRTGLTLPLPEPVRGGSLDELRDLLNVTDETWPQLVGWLVAAMLPDVPHPIALLTGEQGTGKSTAGRLLVQLLDPSAAPLRSSPKDEETWGVSAAASYVVGIDNISSIPLWMSDAMCRAVTGDGLVRRRLYTDSDVSVLSLKRVLVLTSIDAGALRGDLAERLLTVELERIDAKSRRTDRALADAWAVAHPRLLGALLDLVCQVMAALPRAAEELAEHPRMADFAEVLLALDMVHGSRALDSYTRASERLARDVAESDPVARAVLELLAGQSVGWAGSPTALLGELRRFAPDPLPRSWPGDATRLSSHLKRVQPALRASDVELEMRRTYTGREVRLAWSGRVPEETP